MEMRGQEVLEENAARSGRMQGTNEERRFLQDREGAIVSVGLWHGHTLELLLWAETNARQRLVCAATELTYVCAGVHH